MNQFAAKLKLVFIPFVSIAILAIGVYLFLFWLILIRLNLFNTREDMAGPMVFMFIVVVIAVQPRLKLLDMSTQTHGNSMITGLFVAWATMLVPCIPAQGYLTAVTGKLTVLDHISQINNQPPTKYYKLKHFYINKQFAGFNAIAKVSGKSSDYVVVNFYTAAPVFDNAIALLPKGAAQSGIINPSPVAWLAYNHYETISNKLSESEKQAQYKTLVGESLLQFNYKDLNNFVYLERLARYDDSYNNYIVALRKKDSLSKTEPVILLPVNTSFEARTGDKLFWVFGSFGLGCAIFFMMLALKPLR